VLALQDELASAIAHEIHAELTPAEQSRLARAPSVNPEAYDAYLKGRYFFNRPSDENLQKAIARFEETKALEPAFAPAHSGLNPSYAYAHDQFGMALAFQGRLDEAIDEGRRAAELDPLSPQIPLDATLAFAWKGEFGPARQLVKKASDLDPTFFMAPWIAGWIEIQAKKVEDAVAPFQKAEAMESPAFVSAWLAYAHGASRDRTRAAAALAALKKRSLRGSPTSFDLALVHLGLGDHASALSDLERAYATDSQWLGWLGTDRTFDPLRSEPRFTALLRKLGLDGVRAGGRR
jgi:tetratricopeptide (TPR) repeat protein